MLKRTYRTNNMPDSPINNLNPDSSASKSLTIIAGPCAAETREQVIDTALAISKLNMASVFRCGVWKPRSRPGSFEGAGEIALDWLKEVKVLTGLKTAVEVANTSHVEAALRAGVDILWIGARTTVNPFTVSELASSLHGVNVSVMVKNPVNPDIELWVGAIERFASAIKGEVSAIHRGFATYEKKLYKNAPIWDLPIELKRRIPSLPIICDPSHIAGDSKLVQEICQMALDIDMNGLMIECHLNPKAALSDAKQQLTPDELFTLLKSLNYKAESIDNPEYQKTLELYRARIDELDKQMLSALGERMEICRQIGKIKSRNNITILQLKRWQHTLEDRIKLGQSLKLDESFLKQLLQAVHIESIRIQEQEKKD